MVFDVLADGRLSPRRLAFALVLVASVSLGCSPTIEWVPLNAPPRSMSPRPEADVQVFTSAKPTRPYAAVGLLKSETTTAFQNEVELLATLRAEAARRGCDGLLITGTDYFSSAQAANGFATASTKVGGFSAECILFTGDAPAGP